MSGSFNSFNNGLNQTPLDSAYEFSSFSSFINNNINQNTNQNTNYLTNFSPVCIFCSSKNTQILSKDGGSLRHCNSCNKQFKAKIIQ